MKFIERKKLPQISVIVPVYNIEKYLCQCIDSIQKQTYSNLEIILVDDGSVDQSGMICDKYALADSRIRVIHKQNRGLVSARKAGVNIAVGEYIAFVDGDDWIELDTYQSLIENGREADIIAFACYEEYGDYQSVRKNNVKEGLYVSESERGLIYETMLMDTHFYEFGLMASLWSKLIRKDIIVKNQNKVSDQISYGEDVACTFPCLLDATTICVTNMPLYHYRQRQGSIVKSSAKVPRSNFINIYSLLLGKFESVPLYNDVLKMQLYFYMWFILLAKSYGDLGTGMALIPFLKVRSGMKIIIYGAGTFGRAVREYCDKSQSIKVVGWADLHYMTYRGHGLDVTSIDELQNLEFDVVIIAVLNEKTAEKIKEDFVKKGISEERIDWAKKSVLGMIQLPDWVTRRRD
ncbi:MAG: glycosyltransferase [Lachnospiraceae bacterium]|nr:glycosyltransferase [Lachnospiraceae bacterium]